MSDNNKNIIIATGGTGGHVFPAVGLANYLNKNMQIHFPQKKIIYGNLLEKLRNSSEVLGHAAE